MTPALLLMMCEVGLSFAQPLAASTACRLAFVDPQIPTHEVDVIEFNHVCAWNAADVKWDLQLAQLIAWKDVDQGYGFNETCLDWLALERRKNGLPVYPKQSKLKDGRWLVVVSFRGVPHHIKARIIRHTFTQHDPELEDRKLFGRRETLWRD